MRIAFVNNQLVLGGAETVISQLRAGLGRFGHQSTLSVADGKSYPVNSGVEPLYPRLLSRVYHTRLQRWVESAFPRDSWTDRSFRALADSRADVIHLHNFHGKYATVESLAYLAERKPLIWTFHALWGVTGGCDHPRGCTGYLHQCGNCPQAGQWPLGPVDHTREELAAKIRCLRDSPIEVVAPSRYVEDAIRGSQVGDRWPVHCIPNGVDTEHFRAASKRDPVLRRQLGVEPDKTILLVVNRDFDDPLKGSELVREALNGVSRAGVQIVLAGRNTGPMAERIGGGDVLSLGYITDRERLARLFEVADLFLFASPGETFPCVILEAMASGCCVVATPTGGTVEQVEHGSSGVLSEAISGEALRAALVQTLQDGDAQRRLGQAARQRILEHFSETRMIERYLELYQRVAAREVTR